MPPHHVAGVQVLLRSLAAGTTPVLADVADGFTVEAFRRATGTMTGGRRYTAVVPTQLRRLLDEPAGASALASYDAVLVGGAATDPRLLHRARDAGVVAVTTYGMSETCGGCVYDGQPLAGALVRVDDTGRLHLGGATVGTGYLGRPDLTATAFSTAADGTRWFRTDDVGHRDATGRWHVDGRLDDLVVTGGVKVAPRVVEEALTGLDGIAEAVVVGTPDEEWGQVVSAALVLEPGTASPTREQVRDRLRDVLPAAALPRRVVVLPELPLRGPGKPDRDRIAARFADLP
jgi:O-succinylbenzoic acid--CoA ligase